VINNSGDLSGVFSSNDVREVIFTIHIEQLVVMKDIMVSDLICTTPFEDLNTVLQKLTKKNIDALPVMKNEGSRKFIGLIYRRDIISHYNHHIKNIRDQKH
ncbi:CBS domain-containing protein, partial [bacterium]|nr:CBS domain-containing protein [bacterium]